MTKKDGESFKRDDLSSNYNTILIEFSKQKGMFLKTNPFLDN